MDQRVAFIADWLQDEWTMTELVDKCGAPHLSINGERSEMWRSASGSPVIAGISSQTLHITFP